MKSRIKQRITIFVLVAMMIFVSALPSLAAQAVSVEGKPLIGLSWRSDLEQYSEFAKVIEAAGGIPVVLKQVTSEDVVYNQDGRVSAQCLEPSGALKQSYANAIKLKMFTRTNVAEVLKGIDGVFFTGGEDIGLSMLKRRPKEVEKTEEKNATRDVSDYTLMAYCLAKDMPAFATCRGMQLMAVVSGSGLIQDIPTYYAAQGAKYHYTHRMHAAPDKMKYVRHDVELTTKDSHLYHIVGATKLANVSSWHHQAVQDLEGTGLVPTAITVADGVTIIEAVENPEKTFCVGVQFHPENDCCLALVQGHPEKALCQVDACLKFFKELVRYASLKKSVVNDRL